MIQRWILAGLSCGACFCSVAQSGTYSFMFDGALRDYILYVPAVYNAANPAPLVLNLHGYTSNAAEQQYYTEFNTVADTAGCIVVYPNGINEAWNSGFNVPYTSGINDVGFLNALIDTLSAQYSIDPAMIYSTGMSNGGFMSFRLACELDDRIAAIASVTGLMSQGQTANCNPSRKIPVMLIHGTADATVLYNGASFHISADSTVNYWRNKLACSGFAEYYAYPNISISDGCTAENYRWVSCDDGSEVNFIKVAGGGHTWPDAPIDVTVTNHDVNASAEIWKFFYRHRLSPSVATANKNSPSKVKIHPQPATSFCLLEHGFATNYEWQLTDLNHRQVKSGAATGNRLFLDVADLSNGMYFVRLNHNVEVFFTKIIVAR